MSAERKLGIAVVLISILLLLILIPFGVDTPNQVSHITLSPDFWPKIIVSIIGLMGMLMIINPGVEPQEGTVKITNPFSQGLRLAGTLGILFLFYLLVPTLGMVAPAIVLLASMMWFAGERRPRYLLTISICTPFLLYFFFVHVANIPIPLGIFESLRG
ncbi:MAG: tripartite tricarboxylate transporter TctB family protein [Gammaproteobacteria bacterium]|nr:tripartite tricarboxylate transporter TctB family protein [Gammaproteobacteria bacterium]